MDEETEGKRISESMDAGSIRENGIMTGRLEKTKQSESRSASKNQRIWEIDLLRTVAIFLMATFHTVFDLNEFAGIPFNCLSGFWFWEGKVSALLFIFLAGLSSGFSRRTVKRGLKVLFFAMVITLVTFVLFKARYVRFGILHFLGIAMILFPLLKRANTVSLLAGAIAAALLSRPLSNASVESGLLLPFGVSYTGFESLDYYPLCPYLSVFILGILAYKIYYHKKQSLFPFISGNKYISAVSKHSLAIYLIHQPVIVGIIFLLLFVIRS